jgi:hypothetical protein
MPILLLMAGGAMVCGGGGLIAVGRRQLALREAQEFRDAEMAALRDTELIEELRRRVRDAGGDPDTAVAGLRALQQGRLTVAQIESFLMKVGA